MLVVRIHPRQPFECEFGVRNVESSNSAFHTPHLPASVPQQLQGEFRKLVFAGASPAGGSNLSAFVTDSMFSCAVVARMWRSCPRAFRAPRVHLSAQAGALIPSESASNPICRADASARARHRPSRGRA